MAILLISNMSFESTQLPGDTSFSVCRTNVLRALDEIAEQGVTIAEPLDLARRHPFEAELLLKHRISLTPRCRVDIASVFVILRTSEKSIASSVVALVIEVQQERNDDGHDGEAEPGSMPSSVERFVDGKVHERTRCHGKD